MSQTKSKVLYAVYPNASGFGYVYMEGPRKIIDYGVVRISPISNKKVLERIRRSFEYLKPSIVIVQDPEGKSSRTGSRVARLIQMITAFAKEQNLKVYQISRDQIKEVFMNFGASTKYEVAQVLLKEFKELESKSPKKRMLWDGEDRNMVIFDAISLALCWYYLNE